MKRPTRPVTTFERAVCGEAPRRQGTTDGFGKASPTTLAGRVGRRGSLRNRHRWLGLKNLAWVLALGLSLTGFTAEAACDTVNPSNPENDCDMDGYTILAGDCDDNGTLCTAGMCDPAGGPYTYFCICGQRRGYLYKPGQTELCDTKDNNCNSQIDEGLHIDADNDSVRACNTCSAPAAPLCDCNDGNAAIKPGAMEVCDARDNDCDGQTDEGTARSCYSADAGVGVGPCRAGTQQCTATVPGTPAYGACVGEVVPTTEVCDAVDNNCNGANNEGNPGGGAACSTGQSGVCAVGTMTCSASTLQCIRNVNPSAESCDGLDNDCNGTVDNFDRYCFTGPSGTYDGGCPGANCAPKGLCQRGTQTCVDGGWSNPSCTGQVLPTAEVCDKLDNDCNGTVDNGNPGGGAMCSTGQLGVCAPGTEQCRDGGISCVRNVNPSAESCDGLDNNCDGVVDTFTRYCFTGASGTFTGTCPGANCTPRGTCQRDTQTCLDGGWDNLACAAQVLPTAEVCDSLDNDCNGSADNGNPQGGASCMTGQMGVCAAGTMRCQGGTVQCVRNVNPGAEMCDGLDNNCNGVVDEGFDVDMDGYLSCASCSVMPCDCNDNNAAVFPGAPELCDCVDQDCDGQIANGFPDLDGDGVPACAGAAECNDSAPNGAVQHAAWCNRAVVAEVCDALDNDCDGLVDERNTMGQKLQQVCYSGPTGTAGVGLCVPGIRDCNATVPRTASWTACMNEVVPANTPSAPELTCDNKDNDCDGTADDGLAVDADGDGVRACGTCGAPAVPLCDCNDNNAAVKPGATELCDAIDQDCDGQVNDVPARKCFGGMFVTPATYTGTCPGSMCQPRAPCTAGMQTCEASGNWSACAGQVLPLNDPAAAEATCNSIDDDCDGVVDDGNFDQDMDGVTTCAGDCNDGDSAIKPGALEVCDNKDNNCDGTVDGNSTKCYTGPAGTEGVGLCKAGSGPCSMGMPPAVCTGEVLPASEGATCDTKDNDCDGKVDEDFDKDGDGQVSCALCPSVTPCDCDDNDPFNRVGLPDICDCKDNNCNAQVDEGNVCRGAPCHDNDDDGITNCEGDCNDNNPVVGPNRSEQRNNGVDDDCDGAVDEDTDEDGDGYSVGQGDCDDKFVQINPGATELCDGFDNNCNGQTDEGFDKDGDFATSCAGDCDDNDNRRSPFKKEICGNTLDDDCNGLVDEDVDEDLDGVTTCGGDCNDHNTAVFGGMTPHAEVCDGQDNNCNGQSDEGFDVDDDKIATCFGDCDDNDANVAPRKPELASNGKDDNCNGQVDEGTVDNDQDGYSPVCGDCNDADPSVRPHATEVCDRIDNNCDDYVDSAPGQFNLCAACFDADNDGVTNCDGDCNDADPKVYKGASEVCDGKDNDCDGQVDLDSLGIRVCVNDAGLPVDDGGVAGDAGFGDDAGVDVPGEDGGVSKESPLVLTSCGCSSGDFGSQAWWLLAAVPWLWRRRARVTVSKRRAAAPLPPSSIGYARNRAPSGPESLGLPSERDAFVASPPSGDEPTRSSLRGLGSAALTVLAVLFVAGCQSAVRLPLLPDEDGGETVDAGDSDAGIWMPPVEMWDCGDLYPARLIPVLIPGTKNPWAVDPRFTQTPNTAANALLLDDAQAEVAAFVLARPVPNDVDPFDPTAVQTVGVREINALDALLGSPTVKDRIERSGRVLAGPTYSASESLTFSGPTNAYALRNRLLSSFSGIDPQQLGALPVAANSQATPEHVVNIGLRILGGKLFIAVAVTPLLRFTVNQPVMVDLTNGSHLGVENDELAYRCEHRVAPALKSDFIFVVDNSGSMLEEQAALSAAATSLFEAFAASGLDFRIGVVTTDSDVLFGNGFSNVEGDFKNNVRVGIDGNSLEMGLEFGLRAIRHARMATDPNRRLRDDAGLVVVILSDEENAGLMTTAQYAAEYVKEKAVVFAIVGPRPVGCQRVGLGRARAGKAYIDVATVTGGSSGSICNPNLTEVVEDVLFGALGSASKSPLNNRPISGSLSVRTSMKLPRGRQNGFDYDPAGNTVLFFGSVPSAGANFDAAYSFFQGIQ